jgi:hypothetical protein
MNLVDIHDPIIRRAFFKTFDGKCFYTGRSLSIKDMQIDHIVPKTLGGEDTIDNLVLCCQEINLIKNDRYSESFGRVVREVVKLMFLPKLLKVIEELRNNIQLTDNSPTYSDCLYCGTTFLKKRKWQKFCSRQCEWKSWDKQHPRQKLVVSK